MASLRLEELDDGWFPAAGLPWYTSAFGRDALVARLQTLNVYCTFGVGVLERLAQLWGKKHVMALGSYWLETVLGTVRLDFGHTGMKYLGGEKPGWWAVGMIFHLIDSVLIGLAYAAFARPFLLVVGIPVTAIWGSVLGGVLFGIVVWFALAMLIAMPMMGQGVFGYQTKSPRLALLSLGLHILFGALLGLIYIPRI